MHGTGVVFGQRVVLLDDAPQRLPGPLLIPPGTIRPQDHPHRGDTRRTARSGTARSRTAGSGTARPGGVLIPGPGPTLAARLDGATDPVAQQRRADAAEALGARLVVQDQADIAAAGRLCPPAAEEVRHASAMLNLGCWRYSVRQCPPGPRLAGLLDQRPEDFKPALGQGPVHHPDTNPPGITSPDRAVPDDDQAWPQAVLDGIIARQKLIAHLHAQQYTDIAELSGCYPGIHQYLATELALALHTTDADASALLGAAETLRDRLPHTRQALSDGQIDDAKAMALVRATTACTPEVARAVEDQVLPDAGTVTATTVRRRAGRAVIAIDPDGAADRHRQARQDRHVWRAPDQDGMARLGIYAPAQDIATIWEAVTAIADTLKQRGDTRTLGQRRTDAITMVCTDILAGGGWTGLALADKKRGRPRINLTVPYTVLLGHRAPCHLDGHGPIPTEQALPLIAAGDLYRMLCDPASGQLLDYGHTRYKPPPHLVEFVKARDGQCPMPSCHHPADRGHLDHIVPAKPDPVTGKPTLGVTAAHNLAPPCPHHHNGKDAGRGFTLHRATDGTYTWTTPLGRAYTWRPEPHWHRHTDGTGSTGSDGIGSTGSAHGTAWADGTAGTDGTDSTACAAGTDSTDSRLADVSLCDCPDSCPCQHPAESDPDDQLASLTTDHDWADGFATRTDHLDHDDHGVERTGNPPCRPEPPPDTSEPTSVATASRTGDADPPPF